MTVKVCDQLSSQ